MEALEAKRSTRKASKPWRVHFLIGAARPRDLGIRSQGRKQAAPRPIPPRATLTIIILSPTNRFVINALIKAIVL